MQSVIQPLRPKSAEWMLWESGDLVRMGYACERWYNERAKLQVLSAVEVAVDKDGISRGPEYHISISKLNFDKARPRPRRCDSSEAAWVLRQFGLEGAEEDNHVPGGVVRNFWRTVAEPLVGLQCQCKAEEPAIREDKGDFVWRA